MDWLNNHKNIFLNIGKTLLIFLLETTVGYLFGVSGLTEIHIFTIYVLGILVTSAITSSVICSILSVLGIFVFNYLFADPLFSFEAYNIGYPITLIILVIAAIMMGTLAQKNKQHAEELERTAYRTEVLLKTSQQLQKAKCLQDIIDVTANRIMKIVKKNILIFVPNDEEVLKDPQIFLCPGKDQISFEINQTERDAAVWSYNHNRNSGSFSSVYEHAKGTYMTIGTPERIYGVFGIDTEGEQVNAAEMDLVLGECALAFEREFYNRTREKAAIEAKNEKLRSDLLRSISHDLRTPLTGISGNAALLSQEGDSLSSEKRKSLSEGIWKDATWLINMIENLLSITKLGEVEKNISIRPELLEDILLDAMGRVSDTTSHEIILDMSDDMLVVFCNAQLILQVLSNLFENALKYTPDGTKIFVRTWQEDEKIWIEVADEGSGVPDQSKDHIFDMFYTTSGKISDRRRGFGIGLALCKAIIEAHGGDIRVEDNIPHGAKFIFSLKKARYHI